MGVVGQAIIRDLELSDLQFGLLGGVAFAIFYSAFGIPLAWLAERRNRVALISISVALWSAMTMLCGVAQSYWQLLLFRMGVGVGEAGCSPPAHSLLSDHYRPQERAFALGVYSTGVPLGVLVGSVAGGFVAEAFSWRTAMLVAGAPGLLLALLAWLTLREPPRGRLEGASDSAAPPLSRVLRRLAGLPSFRHACAGCALATLAANSIALFAPSYLVRWFGLGLSQVGLLNGLVSGSAGVAGMVLGGLAADLGVRRDVRFYAWAPAIGCALAAPIYLLGYSRTELKPALALILAGWIAVSVAFAPTFALAQNLVEPRMRASAAAVVLFFMNVAGQGLGPLLVGLASDQFASRAFAPGDYRTACLAGGEAALGDACARASALGLRWAILAMVGFFLWGAGHYALAARSLARDLGTAPVGRR